MSALGDPMELHYGAPFPIVGMRLRTSARVVYDCTDLILRIGLVGVEALVEVEFTLDATTPTDPFWSVTVTAEQAATLTPGVAYQYVVVDETGRVLLYGPVSVVDHPRAAV